MMDFAIGFLVGAVVSSAIFVITELFVRRYYILTPREPRLETDS